MNAAISSLVNASANSFYTKGTGTLTLSGGATLGDYNHYWGGSVIVSSGTVGRATWSPSLIVGSNALVGPGGLRQTGGTITLGNSEGGLSVGFYDVYGYYELSNGTLQATRGNGVTSFRFGTRNGAMYFSGGTATVNLGSGPFGNNYFVIGRASANPSVVYATGGTMSVTAGSPSDSAIYLGE